ncbi:MAG: right-handed parallel beta-helix repeat-containing protein [Cyanobacteria bacterium J06628_6]
MATFTVTNLLDAGANSLRQAILDANAMAGADTITFDPLLFNSGLSQTISLTGGELFITDSLSILGPGADLLTIDAQQMSRVFNINDGDNNIFLDVTLDGLTIIGGLTTESGSFDGDGGGIRSFENLTVSNSTVSGNSTTGGGADGGGIFSYGGDLSVSNSTVSGNSTTGTSAFGGGIFGEDGNVSVSNSTVSGNSTTGISALGGGIASLFDDLSVSNSTVSGNSTTGANARGGGIVSAFSSLSVSNSTVSGNSTTGVNADGGGIVRFDGMVSVNNSTVSGNSTTGVNADGGGIVRFDGDVSVESSIIANNTANALGPDVFLGFASTTAGSNNLIGVGDDTGNGTFNIVDGINGNQVGTAASPLDPLLGPLQNNGGPTFTQSPLPGSPAIDMGANPLGLLTDQRGETRSVGQTDIGAVEVQPVVEPPEPPTTVPEPTSVISLALMGAVLGRKVKVMKRQRHGPQRES